MKKVRSGMFAAIVCAASMTLAAQTPPPGGEQSSPASKKQGTTAKDDAKKVTVTGCLERAKEGAAATGTAGTSGSADTTKFVLNNVTPSSSESTTARTGALSRASTSSYRLDVDEAKVSAHVGHKVSITGTVENRASATGAAASASAPRLKVDTITHVSATCTS